jgi:hypothetical protein
MNSTVAVLPSAARAATTTSDDFLNRNAKGLHLVIDVTAITATPSITVTIQGKDYLSGKYYTILASAAISTTGTTVLKVFPGSAVTSNLSANDMLPVNWRVSVTHGDADSITYSIAASLMD